MLGLQPHIEMHQFMDGFYRSMGWAHRAKRHDYKIITTMDDLYGEGGGMESAFHIACDLNLVTKDDLKIWQELIVSESLKKPKKRTTRSSPKKTK